MSEVSSPAQGPDDDFDADTDMARFLADVDAGRELIPDPSETGPTMMLSLGDAATLDPAVLAAIGGPDGLDTAVFGQNGAADVLPPGPVLSALAEEAAAGAGALTDDQLLGALSAARRLANRAAYLETLAIAEFTRRRAAQLAAAQARQARAKQAWRGPREGEHADAELAFHLTTTIADASDQMEVAAALTSRLPATLAALAAGTVDYGRACSIWYYTRFLSDAHAAHADAILAAAAPDLRHDQLARKAAALEIKLDPAAARARKEHARKQDRRVEAGREASGNMSYGGRELAVEEGLAVKAAVDAAAAALRRAGLGGTLNELRLITFLDRLLGRDPLDRLNPDSPGGADTPGTAGTADVAGASASPGTPDSADAGAGPGAPGGQPGPGDRPGGDDRGSQHDNREHYQDEHDGDGRGDEQDGRGDDSIHGDGTEPHRTGRPVDSPAPLPALINLVIPAGTLLGWSTAPGDAGTWGLLDPDDTGTIVHAASRHPRTRWCLTVTGTDGTAVAHGCARGPHSWTPEPGSTAATDPDTARAGPDPPQRAQLARLLDDLDITMTPIARDSCDHSQQETRYTPSRNLRHLIQARTIRCPAPGCGAQACHNDQDHTVPWPLGPTDQCNLAPPCRRHHRAKQAPGWTLEQPQPGVMKWTLPSGRVYTTTPTVYDL